MRKDGTSFMAHVVIDHQDGRDVFPIGNRFIFAAQEIFVLGYVVSDEKPTPPTEVPYRTD
jgi:hypothetical protein